MNRCNVPLALQAIDDPLQQEVNNVANQVHPRAHAHVTIAIAEVRTDQGIIKVAATSGKPGGFDSRFAPYLPPDVMPVDTKKVMFPGRPHGNAHAEESIVAWANENNGEIIKIAASRPVCPEICLPVLQMYHPSAEIVTPIRK